jgi:Xaa-Pro aminopeptidase
MQLVRVRPNRERLGKLADLLQQTSVDRLLLSETPNVFYLVGVWPIGRTVLSVSRAGDLSIFGSKLDLFLSESDEVDVFTGRGEAEISEELIKRIAATGDAYVETDGIVPLDGRSRPECRALVRLGNSIVQGIRSVKDEEEIRLMKRSGELAKEGMKAALERTKVGVSEKDIARSAQCAMLEKGADEFAFRTSVGSGWRASLPHALPTEKRVADGELVVIDLGADVEHYKSDITRTVLVGAPNGQTRKVFDSVKGAYDACVEDVAPGAKTNDLALKADRILSSAGFSEGILHGLGHGVGLDIHEEPSVSAKSLGKLVSSNVITIEPGVYIRGVTGARWENTVLVTSAGHDILT